MTLVISTDFAVSHHGSVAILHALIDPALAWVEEHLPEGRLTWAETGTVIEPRHLETVVAGLQPDGHSI